MTPYTLRDRLDLSQEIMSIGDELTSIEQRGGRTAETEQLRRRLQHVQVVVLGQLRALLNDPCESGVKMTSLGIH